MRYIMQQRLFSFRDRYVIRDEAGEDRFFAEGALLSWGDRLTLCDRSGSELIAIRQKLLSWGPTYEIHRHGELAAVLKKDQFTLFRCRFTLDVPGPHDLEAAGELFHHEYRFERITTSRTAAVISKKWFSLADTYGVEIAEEEDDVLLLAASIVIDLACHNNDGGLFGISG